MRGLTAEEILRLAELADPLPPVDRAVLLAGASGVADVDRLPLGRRDAVLLRLRAATVGDALTGWAPCPHCAVQAEFITTCTALLAAEADTVDPEPILVDGHLVHWRLPNSRDAAAIAGCLDPDEAADLLLRRCLVGEPGVDGAAARGAVSAQMAKADPLAELVIAMACPECGTRWESPLDVADFFLAELRARAEHLLTDVDTLARAYGWREPDILALSDARRSAYLARVRHG